MGTKCFCWNQEMKGEFAEESSRFLRLPEGPTDLFLYKILEAAVAVLIFVSIRMVTNGEGD